MGDSIYRKSTNYIGGLLANHVLTSIYMGTIGGQRWQHIIWGHGDCPYVLSPCSYIQWGQRWQSPYSVPTVNLYSCFVEVIKKPSILAGLQFWVRHLPRVAYCE